MLGVISICLISICHQLMTINAIFIYCLIPIFCGFSHIYSEKYLNNKFVNQDIIERDKRLLRNFYLSKGFYDVDIQSATVKFLDDKSFNSLKMVIGLTSVISSRKFVSTLDS